MKKDALVLTAGLIAGVALQGCAGKSPTAPPSAKLSAEPNAPETAKLPTPVAPIVYSGKVVETMTSGGYTYIALEKDGKVGWSAVPSTDVKVGQELEIQRGMEMGRFSSKTLNRTFDNIIFSPGIATGGAAKPATEAQASHGAANQLQMPPGHPPTSSKKKGMEAMMSAMGQEATAPLSGKVIETLNGGGYTYVNLEKDGKTTWAAIPTTDVQVGQELKLEPGAVMSNFTSKTLNKTFESVIFSGGPIQ